MPPEWSAHGFYDARAPIRLLEYIVVSRIPVLAFTALLAVGALRCVRIVPSNLEQSDAAGAGPGGDSGGNGNAAPDARPDAVTGRVCVDDPQCDDAIDCTLDACDPMTKRCRNAPDDSKCQNGRYCDGAEKCDPIQGCVAGDPVTCSDAVSCTIDRCVEGDIPTCVHEPRDADGDGDPDYHCPGGGDCNDLDPLVNSHVPEICNNQKDDDCDGVVDEPDCVTSKYDTCSDPLVLVVDTPVVLSPAGSQLDYAASCVPTGIPGMRDMVAAFEVPQGGPFDLDVVAKTQWNHVYISLVRKCADPSTELACAMPAPGGQAGMIARFLVRNVKAGTYPIYVFTDGVDTISLTAHLQPASPAPTNETCGTAQPIVPGDVVTATIIGVARDLATACPASPGDLVYWFQTSQPQDIHIYASSIDGFGDPVIGLRKSGCVDVSEEIACRTDAALELFVRAPNPDAFFVDVSATVPANIQFQVVLEPPSPVPADETCVSAPAIEPGKTVLVSLDAHTDDVRNTCMTGAVDAAYTLDLSRSSDVLLVERTSQGDPGAVSLMRPGCAAGDRVACATSAVSPVRVSAHNVPAGSYRAIVETQEGNPVQLTALVRAATPATFVVFADTCADALLVPESGGFFQGNTENAVADYSAGCDQGGGSPAGAPDQMLRLELASPKRVVLDMRGSSYTTLLDVRRGPQCPGTEITNACAVGYYDQRSYLDLHLDAGSYFLQVDGLAGQAGQWFLDVYVTDP